MRWTAGEAVKVTAMAAMVGTLIGLGADTAVQEIAKLGLGNVLLGAKLGLGGMDFGELARWGMGGGAALGTAAAAFMGGDNALSLGKSIKEKLASRKRDALATQGQAPKPPKA